MSNETKVNNYFVCNICDYKYKRIINSMFFSSQVLWIFLKSEISRFIFSAINPVPAFPGKQNILLTTLDSLSLKQSECSLPPLPIIPMFIYILYN